MTSRGEDGKEGGGLFHETQWGQITYPLGAPEERVRGSWEEFCNTYRKPLLCLICRRGFNAIDAEDVAHDFLLHFLQSGALARAHPSKGRFRDYLCASLKHYLANVRARTQAQKRGGGLVATGVEALENLPAPETASPAEWARVERSLAQALARVQKLYRGKGRAGLFALLRPFVLETEDAPPYRKLAGKLHGTPATLRSDMKRLRARLRKELGRLRGEARP